MTAEDKQAARAPRLEPLTRLATGGMAEIWLARELGAHGIERLVVVKRLLPHLAREPTIVDMFVSEARFVARLVHPNVVQIHELAEDEQGYFLVMEYVAGCSVREVTNALTKAGDKLAPADALCIIEQACRGAHAAHELTDSSGRPLGLVHRDITPHNLMIGPGGDVKLLDFGIAKATEAAESTHTGSLKGKSGYMSPEQCRGKRLDRRSDIFALGIALWELLTGERLFVRDSEYASMDAIVSGAIKLPSEVRSELPQALDAVVAKALEKDPDDRWQTAEDLRRALIEAADASNLRPSRDALADTLTHLLGARLDQRQAALQNAASQTGAVDTGELVDALAYSDPSARSRSEVGARSRSLTDDDATVVQRGSGQPPAVATAVSAERDAVGASARQRSEPAEDDHTLVDRRRTAPVAALLDEAAPVPLARRASKPPSAVPMKKSSARVYWMAAAALLIALGAMAYTLLEPTPAVPASSVSVATTSSAEPVLAGPALRFVVAPTVEPDVIRSEMASFARWLGTSLGRPIEIVVADSYQDCGDRLIAGKSEFGLLPPLLFVQTVAREPRVQPVVLRLFDGSRGSDGYILVRDDTTLAGAADLRGRNVCFVDRESTTGFLLPRIWMRSAGLDPDKDVTSVFSGDHLAVMRDLEAGKCDAAAVYSGAFLSGGPQGIRVGAMRVLAITGRVPQDVVTAAPDVPEADVKRWRDLLTGFKPERDIDAGRIGTVLGITGFAPFDPKELELIRQAAESEGMLNSAGGAP